MRIMQIPVQILRLPGNTQPLPAYQTGHAAGMDVHANLEAAVELAPGAIAFIPTGFSVAIPPGFEIQIRPRSGLACKFGVTLPNSPGTIDADYRGEVKVALINLGQAPFTVEPGMRIAQAVLAHVPVCVWHEVAQLSETARGEGGFGSTGVHK